jgi:hypothetical protein
MFAQAAARRDADSQPDGQPPGGEVIDGAAQV